MKNVTRRLGLAVAVLGLMAGSVKQANAGLQLVMNGGFESGSFANWSVGSTQVTPYIAALNDGQNAQIVNSTSGQPAWFLRNKSANLFGTPATPITNYSAFNGFDGSPGYFFLRQDFSLSGPLETAILDFDYAVQSNYSGTSRVFSANILDTSNNLLASVFSYTRPTGELLAWSPTSVSTDIASSLNALGAGNYKLEFRIDIPQDFTGPAQFAIDNISLDATVSAVPEPSTIALVFTALPVGLGFAWKRCRMAVVA